MTKKITSPEDLDLFRQSVAGARTLSTDKVLLKKTDKPRPFPNPKVYPEPTLLPGFADDPIEAVGAEDSISYAKPGISKNVLKKLRQGYFGPDAELDLHGLTSTEAQRRLSAFFTTSIQRNCRCLHIVHGKGHRSVDNQPVLKNHLNQWLRQHNEVLAFCSASPKDGGTGAVWVLLRSRY